MSPRYVQIAYCCIYIYSRHWILIPPNQPASKRFARSAGRSKSFISCCTRWSCASGASRPVEVISGMMIFEMEWLDIFIRKLDWMNISQYFHMMVCPIMISWPVESYNPNSIFMDDCILIILNPDWTSTAGVLCDSGWIASFAALVNQLAIIYYDPRTTWKVQPKSWGIGPHRWRSRCIQENDDHSVFQDLKPTLSPWNLMYFNGFMVKIG